ncbi:MAG: acyltransferase [Rhodobacteraceae bacterium]|nr:acyltransferase [Paracoccaceae bacterium]
MEQPTPGDGPVRNPVYDRAQLTYANSYDSLSKRALIHAVEWVTGKIEIVRRISQFERQGAPIGQAFWPATMEAMGIDLRTPATQLARIPTSGPTVLVANHPHGMVDGMILADLIGRVRDDYRILTRRLLTGLDESAAKYMISVPFPHEDDAQRKMLDMRAAAMDHLGKGGLIALFPSGGVAASETMFGPAIEGEWSAFTAKMIRRSGAQVVPCYFPGTNSRAYHIANRISPTLRQSLLLHEVVYSFDKPQKPVIGPVFDPAEVEERGRDPRKLVAWLRECTLALRETA